jgi:excisionase family DNA binding protein
MSTHLFTVNQVAEFLNLHVKTVRRYVRTGHLKAKRIGKEYRVTRADLEAFSGSTHKAPDTVSRMRQVIASSIVDIDAISPEDSQRITTLIMAGLNARKGEGDFPRVDSVYYPERGQLRIMITASPALTCELLQTIAALTKDRHG